MSDSAVMDFTGRLKSEFRMHVVSPGSWAEDKLRRAGEAVEDLATLGRDLSMARVMDALWSAGRSLP
jgi:hypothetical protein